VHSLGRLCCASWIGLIPRTVTEAKNVVVAIHEVTISPGRRTAIENSTHYRARFRAITESTRDEWQLIWGELERFAQKLPDRLIAHLNLLRGDHGGFPVDRLEHCLQTATRAYRAGQDEEYVVCALLHDIGDWLGPRNHPDIAATIVQPFVSDENHWMVKHHGIFQGIIFSIS
jgi:hypothetical protein